MAERLKLAFVGCGAIAAAHWRGIQNQAPEIDVTAVIDTNPERLAEFAALTGGEAFTSLDEALQHGDFDAVDLMLPHFLHVDASVASFAAGKHVCLEKPMAPDLASCQTILDAAAEAGTVFMVAEQSQYWPDVQKAKSLIDAGEIGTVISARAHFFDRWQLDPNGPLPWRFQTEKAGGGISMDGAAHWIRPLRIWFGEINELVAATARPIEAMEPESLVHAIFRFEDGMFATLTALNSTGQGAPGDAFRITGTTGEITIQLGRSGGMLLYNESSPDGKVVSETTQTNRSAYGYELHDFSQAVLKGTELAASPEYSLGELKTALAIYRSVKSRTWEKV